VTYACRRPPPGLLALADAARMIPLSPSATNCGSSVFFAVEPCQNNADRANWIDRLFRIWLMLGLSM
jgi:hypothetical protein